MSYLKQLQEAKEQYELLDQISDESIKDTINKVLDKFNTKVLAIDNHTLTNIDRCIDVLQRNRRFEIEMNDQDRLYLFMDDGLFLLSDVNDVMAKTFNYIDSKISDVVKGNIDLDYTTQFGSLILDLSVVNGKVKIEQYKAKVSEYIKFNNHVVEDLAGYYKNHYNKHNTLLKNINHTLNRLRNESGKHDTSINEVITQLIRYSVMIVSCIRAYQSGIQRMVTRVLKV